MAIQDARVEELCDRWCQTPSLSEFWSNMLAKYKSMGFTDVLEDRTRIEEYNYILKELRKYISKNENDLRSSMTLDDLRSRIEHMLETSKEFTQERKLLVYYILRDEWIIAFHEEVAMLSQDGDDTVQDW